MQFFSVFQAEFAQLFSDNQCPAVLNWALAFIGEANLETVSIELIELPVASGNKLVIKKERLDHLCKLFPRVDVVDELKVLQLVLENNPELVKKRSATPAFYTKWLESIQRRREDWARAV